MTLFSVAVGWPHTPVPGLIVEELRSLALKVDSVYRIIRSKLSDIRIICTIRIVGASTDDLKRGLSYPCLRSCVFLIVSKLKRQTLLF